MAYAAAADLDGLIPAEWRIAATDDDGDATAEAISAVLSAAADEIDGTLSTRYSVPVDVSSGSGPTAYLRHCCRYLAAELCYARRGMQAEFPFVKQLEAVRLTLRQIAQGKIPLFPTLAAAVSEDAAIIGVPSRLGSGSRMSF